MAQPASRTDLINYCKRQLGAPVLEINIADEQVDDLVDDALQYFHERHFDGVIQTFLKYKITQDDIDRGRGKGSNNPVGIGEHSNIMDAVTQELDAISKQHDRLEVIEKYVEGREKNNCFKYS